MTAEVRAWAIEQVARALEPILFGNRPDREVGPATRSERNWARRRAGYVLALLPTLLTDDRVLEAAIDHLSDEHVRARAMEVVGRVPGTYGIAASGAAIAEVLAGQP